MIFDFGSLKITDNTSEAKKNGNVVFLLTSQNFRYYQKDKKYIKKVFTPKEIIKVLGLTDIKVIGVTGTNGKTTTTALIYSLFLDLGYNCALQGTRGFFINDRRIKQRSLTTPPILETLENMYNARKEGVDYFVMEVSSHGISQNRIEGIKFAAKVLTNITHDHLDYHKNLQNYIRTKNSFFQDESVKIINFDEKNASFNPVNLYTYAIERSAVFKIEAYCTSSVLSGVVRFRREKEFFESSLVGHFNLYNILGAIACVKVLTDFSLKEICEKVENFGGVKGRMEIVSFSPLIIVDYAHTPDGMQKVFESFLSRELVCVFGAGGDRDRDKRELMGKIADKYCKKIYLTSDNPRNEKPEEIAKDISKGIKKKFIVEIDREKAIFRAIKEMKKDDVLLVLGKGDEENIEIDNKKIPFNDKKVIKSILNRLDKN